MLLHLSGSVNNLIKSDISTVLNVFLLLSVSQRFFEVFDDQVRGRRYHFSLALSVLNGHFHCNPLVAVVMSSPTFLGNRPRGPVLVARAGMAPTSPPVHLRYMTLISLGLNVSSMVEAAGVR